MKQGIEFLKKDPELVHFSKSRPYVNIYATMYMHT